MALSVATALGHFLHMSIVKYIRQCLINTEPEHIVSMAIKQILDPLSPPRTVKRQRMHFGADWVEARVHHFITTTSSLDVLGNSQVQYFVHVAALERAVFRQVSTVNRIAHLTS